MSLFSTLYPDKCIDSAYSIDYEGLFGEGYRGIIYDIDNTLVPDNAPADERSIELISRLKDMGYKCLILSNNDIGRVKSFSDMVGAEYIFKAGKPSRAGYLKAMEMMGTDVKTTFFVGDQLFTDIWGANRAGIRNFLVGRIDKRERTHIIFKRMLEKPIMFFYRLSLKKKGIPEDK
ncbi:MAG: YqeG family HAD IIIA-type phosphatase [Lachnospiraceae bacterium]|nr:YqeG family HAD IIIA-type phosphatase [Lachnospiraceae bacterium]